MAYKAQGLGGIDGSGVRMPNTQPLIDVGSIIDSASKAFANNREGVLHRALLQQAANREEQQHQLRVAEAANNGTMTVDAARRLVDQGGFEDETPDAAQAPAATTPGAPPPVDAALEGAPGQLIAPTPATGTAPALKPRKSKYTMVDLGNGYATIPELTPGYRQAQMLGTRLDAQGRQIVERGDQQRQTLGVKDEFTTGRDATKHGFDMEKQAAALKAHIQIAQMRASMKGDPSAMTPGARMTLLGKLADTYVQASGGDPDKAVEMAENDPTLPTFGTNPKQLQSFIAGAVGKYQQKAVDASVRSQGQTFDTPQQDQARRQTTKGIVAPAKATAGAKQTITGAEASQLKALGHTDADIAAHYTVK